MYAFAKFFFYYEYSTIVFDLAIVWNLISDLIYDYFGEFCVCVYVGGSVLLLLFFFPLLFCHGLIICETCHVKNCHV